VLFDTGDQYYKLTVIPQCGQYWEYRYSIMAGGIYSILAGGNVNDL